MLSESQSRLFHFELFSWKTLEKSVGRMRVKRWEKYRHRFHNIYLEIFCVSICDQKGIHLFGCCTIVVIRCMFVLFNVKQTGIYPFYTANIYLVICYNKNKCLIRHYSVNTFFVYCGIACYKYVIQNASSVSIAPIIFCIKHPHDVAVWFLCACVFSILLYSPHSVSLALVVIARMPQL